MATIKVLIIASFGSLITTGVFAQSDMQPNPGPSPTPPQPGFAQQIPEAPIGHRQPNASDVPSNVLRSEGDRTDEDKKLDKELNICRGC
jgi:hypothetical protein